MKKEIIEIMSVYDVDEPVQRMKIGALKRHLANDFDFRSFNEQGEPDCVLINNFLYYSPFVERLDEATSRFRLTPGTREALMKKRAHAVIMLFVSDLHPAIVPLFHVWAEVVDVFLVSTPEMRNFLLPFTDRSVDILFDPIDFCLEESVENFHDGGPIKVIWFGYPESFRKSFSEYDRALRELHRNNEIEYHIVTRNESYGPGAFVHVHGYDHKTFASLLATFDVCVLSHTPFDFSINTFLKSENKAVLAINRGLAAVATRTPAYERLFRNCGLEEFLFSSQAELVSTVRRLKSSYERHRFLALSQRYVLENYAALRMARDWRALYQNARGRKL
jgi:hypothetical protein